MGGGRFSDGFLVGAVFGAAAFFLLGTKKGNKILKVISEEGATELSSLINEFEKRSAGLEPEPSQTPPKSSEENHETPGNPPANGEKSSKPRRFFKKSK
ncbi:MAG: hypothetical protein A3A51_04030 [Candidatus Levybacteria bacterium RIFCSPLOWO2_01_FULL_39_10]|nr:MAG: hypothetical protein A3A51_04030 [Candidatus Levybacteria bacterium RIFCSPLOWO2_01_FULL_39_10]